MKKKKTIKKLKTKWKQKKKETKITKENKQKTKWKRLIFQLSAICLN